MTMKAAAASTGWARPCSFSLTLAALTLSMRAVSPLNPCHPDAPDLALTDEGQRASLGSQVRGDIDVARRRGKTDRSKLNQLISIEHEGIASPLPLRVAAQQFARY